MSARRSTPADVASALGGASMGEGKWQVRCPTHDDRNPSLSIGVSQNGRTLLDCFAGCSYEAIIDALEHDFGLVLRNPKGAGGPRRPARKAKSRAREDDAAASVFTAEPQPSQPLAGDGAQETPEESEGREPSGSLPAEDTAARAQTGWREPSSGRREASRHQGGNGHAEAADDPFLPIIPPPPGVDWRYSGQLCRLRGEIVGAFEYHNAACELEGLVLGSAQ